jgi:predicted DNA repair protein MutK
MSVGLIALLDDIAGLAKLAAASVDDVVGHAAKVSVKSSGILIDDAAVAPRYVVGLDPSRELPIIARIVKGSLINKLVFLLPIALLLSFFAAWAITPLLMLGGCYLAYEGAEKVFESLFHHGEDAAKPKTAAKVSPEALENAKVSSAVRTDFILSAEIMVLALSAIPAGGFWSRAAVLAVVGIMITLAVYGVVALIVKADDMGLALARGATGLRRRIGLGIVKAMPPFLSALAIVGTAAMIWVGGGILVHGLESFGISQPGHLIHTLSHAVHEAAPIAKGFAGWVVEATLFGVVGLLVGFLLIPVVTYLLAPIAGWVRGLRGQPAV